MEFKNYCIIVLGKTDGCKTEIVKISEDNPRFMESKGVTIATFLSVANTDELTDYFKSFNRNFLIFTLNNEVSGFNLNDKEIENLLFGNLDILREIKNSKIKDITSSSENKKENSKISDKTNELFEDLNKEVKEIDLKLENKYVKSKVKYVISENMGKSEVTEIINNLLDKGYDNLDDYDKDLLTKLSKLSSEF